MTTMLSPKYFYQYQEFLMLDINLKVNGKVNLEQHRFRKNRLAPVIFEEGHTMLGELISLFL